MTGSWLMHRRAIAVSLALFLLSSLARIDAEDLSKVPRITEPDALVYVPRISYPNRAKYLKLTGSGIVVLDVDPTTGRVNDARMARSTGEEILDRAALEGLRQLSFEKGPRTASRLPVTFAGRRNL